MRKIFKVASACLLSGALLMSVPVGNSSTLSSVVSAETTFEDGLYINNAANPVFYTFKEFRSLSSSEKKTLLSQIMSIRLVMQNQVITLLDAVTKPDSDLLDAFTEATPEELPYTYQSPTTDEDDEATIPEVIEIY